MTTINHQQQTHDITVTHIVRSCFLATILLSHRIKDNIHGVQNEVRAIEYIAECVFWSQCGQPKNGTQDTCRFRALLQTRLCSGVQTSANAQISTTSDPGFKSRFSD